MSISETLANSPWRRRSPAIQLVAVLLIAVALAGCGKKGSPTAPADAPNTYPRPYPSE